MVDGSTVPSVAPMKTSKGKTNVVTVVKAQSQLIQLEEVGSPDLREVLAPYLDKWVAPED